MLEKIIIIYFYGAFFGQILEKNKNSIIKTEEKLILSILIITILLQNQYETLFNNQIT